MRKQVLFLLIFICTHLCSQAQYFDWVQTYTGSEATYSTSTNCIKQSVADSAGNVYFIGVCSVDAGFDNNRFLSFTPYGSYWNTPSIVIGGITPDGNLKWSKAVNSNNGFKTLFGHIQLVGDSAVACFVNMVSLYANSFNAYTFFLDTLFRLCYYDSNGTLVYGQNLVYNGDTLDYARSRVVSAYVSSDYDGNTKETHWLSVAPYDRNGELFEYGGLYWNHSLYSDDSPFTLDNNGNIIIIRTMTEYVLMYDSIGERNVQYDISNHIIGGLRFYVDGKRHFDVQLPDVRPSTGKHNYQILKFSPHFDSLLASQFLFEPTPEHLDSLGVFRILDLETDPDNNIFILGTYGRDLSISNDSCSFQIGGSEDVRLHFSMYDESRGFLLKYDSTLTPVYLKQIGRKDVDTPSENNRYYDGFNVMQFDDNGNIALLGATAYNDTVNTRCWFDSTELKVKGFLILRVDPDDGRLVSCKNSEISSPAMGSSAGNSTCLVAKNNRLVTQLFYRWYLNFADSLYEKPREYEWGMGFAVWDYDGNELCFVDYGTNGGSRHATSSVCLVDSVLYLTGMLASGGAQFGDVTVPNSGSSQSFIARYVDTAFMHPYVRPGSQQDIQLVVRDGEPVVTVYPNPCAQRVTVDWDGDEPPLAATVTDITGRTYSVALTAAGAGQSDSGAKITGRYTIDFSSLPAANYLLTLTTPSGHRVTTRLLKR